MYFAIRDDDTAFFTKPEELERAYDFIRDGIISLSIVPHTVPQHKNDIFPYGQNIPYQTYNIKENEELISYLKKGVEKKKYDILLHGYSHEYKYVGDKWKAELIWKDLATLKKELRKAKLELEELFETSIKVLVAPNNAIGKNGIEVAEELEMDYSGIIYFNDRKITFNYIHNFLKRWIFRVIKGVAYPGILEYKKHKEMVAYPLDNIERLKKEYELCKKNNKPFVIYTHYWDLNLHNENKKLLQEIYEYVIQDGAILVGLTQCFEKNRYYYKGGK